MMDLAKHSAPRDTRLPPLSLSLSLSHLCHPAGPKSPPHIVSLILHPKKLLQTKLAAMGPGHPRFRLPLPPFSLSGRGARSELMSSRPFTAFWMSFKEFWIASRPRLLLLFPARQKIQGAGGVPERPDKGLERETHLSTAQLLLSQNRSSIPVQGIPGLVVVCVFSLLRTSGHPVPRRGSSGLFHLQTGSRTGCGLSICRWWVWKDKRHMSTDCRPPGFFDKYELHPLICRFFPDCLFAAFAHIAFSSPRA